MQQGGRRVRGERAQRGRGCGVCAACVRRVCGVCAACVRRRTARGAKPEKPQSDPKGASTSAAAEQKRGKRQLSGEANTWRRTGTCSVRAVCMQCACSAHAVRICSAHATVHAYAVEWRGEHLEAHAEGRAQLLERGRGAGRLHAAAALIAALQREQSCQAAVGGSQKRAQPPRRPCALLLLLLLLLLLGLLLLLLLLLLFLARLRAAPLLAALEPPPPPPPPLRRRAVGLPQRPQLAEMRVRHHHRLARTRKLQEPRAPLLLRRARAPAASRLSRRRRARQQLTAHTHLCLCSARP